LLDEAGYRFTIITPSEAAEDGRRRGESPAELVARLARQKAADVARRVESGLVLGCDTVVTLDDVEQRDGRILGKPDDEAHARAMLETLSGRRHRVLSGLCLWQVPGDRVIVRVAVATLEMDRLSEDQLAAYLASGGWRGKAGAFGYQDRLGWVHVTEGSESNVVGLPMELLAEMLAS